MQIYIPVTLLRKFQMQSEVTRYSSIHPQTITGTQKLISEKDQNYSSRNKHNRFSQSDESDSRPKKHQQTHLGHENQDFYSDKFQCLVPKQIFHAYRDDRGDKMQNCSDSLQKKSTSSQLHPSVPNNRQIPDALQSSVSKLAFNYSKRSGRQKNIHSKQNNLEKRDNMETQSDILVEEQCCCKICLESNQQDQYDNVNNPIYKVCCCTDFIHLKCLQEWITRRDILNQQIQPDQCEICLKFYAVNIVLQQYLSCQTFQTKFSRQKITLITQFMPILTLFILTILSFYVFVALLVQSDSETGSIKELLRMPYATSIAISIFLLLVVFLVFFVVFYTWVKEHFTNLRYKVLVKSSQKGEIRLKK